MNKVIINLFLACITINSLNAQNINLKPFSHLKILDGISLNLKKSENNSIEKWTDNSPINALQIENVNDTLIIKLKNRILNTDEYDYTFNLKYSNKIKSIFANNGANVSSPDEVINFDSNISLTSKNKSWIWHADEYLKEFNTVNIYLENNGNMQIKGKCKNLNIIAIASQGFGDGDSLYSENLNVKIDKGSDISLETKGVIELDISNGSKISIKGNPKIIFKNRDVGTIIDKTN